MLLNWAIVVGVIALIVLFLGARGIASLTFGIAKLVFAILLVIAAVLLITHYLQ